MRVIIFWLIFLNSSVIFGQASKTNKKYNFDKDCNIGGQQNINYCLSKAVDKYYKVMGKKYTCVTAYFDGQIKLYSTTDSSVAADYKKNKRSLTSSQSTWNKLKNGDAAYYEGGGGTIIPMLVAQSMIQDFENRLKWLDDLIEEEGQGNETKILKCE